MRDAPSVHGKLYGNRARRTLLRRDFRNIEWPETDWFPSVGSCELLINNIKRADIFGGFCQVLRKFFRQRSVREFHLIQEEATTDEIPQNLEFDITDLSEIEKSALFRSNYSSVLCDENCTFALKLHYEGFGYLSGPDKLCEALRENCVLARVIEDVRWKN
jgi:hypothetical protein